MIKAVFYGCRVGPIRTANEEYSKFIRKSIKELEEKIRIIRLPFKKFDWEPTDKRNPILHRKFGRIT